MTEFEKVFKKAEMEKKLTPILIRGGITLFLTFVFTFYGIYSTINRGAFNLIETIVFFIVFFIACYSIITVYVWFSRLVHNWILGFVVFVIAFGIIATMNLSDSAVNVLIAIIAIFSFGLDTLRVIKYVRFNKENAEAGVQPANYIPDVNVPASNNEQAAQGTVQDNNSVN